MSQTPILPLIRIPSLTVPYLTNDLLDSLFTSLNKNSSVFFEPVYLVDYWALVALKVQDKDLYDESETDSKISTLERRRTGLKHCNLQEFLNVYVNKAPNSAFPTLILSTPHTKSSNSGVLSGPSSAGIQKAQYAEIRRVCRELWRVPYVMGCIEEGNVAKTLQKMPELRYEAPSASFEIPMYVHDSQFKQGYKMFQAWRNDSEGAERIVALATHLDLRTHRDQLDGLCNESEGTIFMMPHMHHRDHPLDIIDILMDRQVHLFGSEYPFLQAQLGYAITFPLEEQEGNQRPYKRHLHNVELYAKDFSPVDASCDCICCKEYTRAYICHLLQAHEMSAFVLLTYHNLYHYYKFFGKLNEVRDSQVGLERLRRVLKVSQKNAEC